MIIVKGRIENKEYKVSWMPSELYGYNFILSWSTQSAINQIKNQIQNLKENDYYYCIDERNILESYETIITYENLPTRLYKNEYINIDGEKYQIEEVEVTNEDIIYNISKIIKVNDNLEDYETTKKYIDKTKNETILDLEGILKQYEYRLQEEENRENKEKEKGMKIFNKINNWLNR